MIKAFLFDKDGTLIDFKSIWLPVTQGVIGDIAQKYNLQGLEEALLTSIGVHGEEIDSTGILAAKTSVEVATVWHTLLHQTVDLQQFIEEVKESFLMQIEKNIHKVALLPGVKEALTILRQQGFKLGIATADSQSNTELMLKHLGIREWFEFVGAEDGKTPAKPDIAHMQNFCKVIGMKPEEVAMVGDTLCDMQFGKASGAYTIGVLSGTGSEALLGTYADCLLTSVAALPCEMGQIA